MRDSLHNTAWLWWWLMNSLVKTAAFGKVFFKWLWWLYLLLLPPYLPRMYVCAIIRWWLFWPYLLKSSGVVSSNLFSQLPRYVWVSVCSDIMQVIDHLPCVCVCVWIHGPFCFTLLRLICQLNHWWTFKLTSHYWLIFKVPFLHTCIVCTIYMCVYLPFCDT